MTFVLLVRKVLPEIDVPDIKTLLISLVLMCKETFQVTTFVDVGKFYVNIWFEVQ